MNKAARLALSQTPTRFKLMLVASVIVNVVLITMLFLSTAGDDAPPTARRGTANSPRRQTYDCPVCPPASASNNAGT